MADWDYIAHCAEYADPMPLFGNGDVMNFEDYYHYKENSKIAGALLARGALIKPWLFTELKEKRHWDISAQERLEIFKEYTNYGLDHWGTDTRGVENTRRFLLEWMSFTHRYIPLGVLERPIHRINERPPCEYNYLVCTLLFSFRAIKQYLCCRLLWKVRPGDTAEFVALQRLD